MSLFHDELHLPCSVNEWDLICRPVNGDGGAQRLLRRIQACAIAERTLRMEPMLLDKAYAYAYHYGSGGFEDRFRAVIAAAERTGQWSAEGIRVRQRRTTSPGKQWNGRA